MKTLAPALLLAFAPAILAAQEFDDEKGLKAYLSLGQTMAHGHAHDLTQTTWGGPGAYHAEFGVQFLHEQSTLLMRPNVGYTRILSREPKVDEDGRAQTIYDALGIFVGIDLVYTVSKRLPLTVTAGPSFHSWSVERIHPPYEEDPRQGDRDLKLGFRMGLGYEFSSQFRLDMTYTMTEWRSNMEGGANRGYVQGFNPSLPAYFTVKGTYTF